MTPRNSTRDKNNPDIFEQKKKSICYNNIVFEIEILRMEVLMGTRHLSGTPWHVEYASAKKDGVQKRHKSRCKFYRKEKNRCLVLGNRCTGSGLCARYSELTEKEKAIKEDVRRKALFYKEATPFKEQSVFESTTEQKKKKKRKK